MSHGCCHDGPPTAVLKSEHEVILRVLTSFENMLRRVEAGAPLDAGFFGNAADFLQVFADRCHHAKEERHLFPAMEQAGIPRNGGPIGMMLEEHDQGRAYVREIVAGVEEIPTRPDEAKTRILNNGQAYVDLLRAHIRKENEVLFPMADQMIAPERMSAIRRDFEATETEMGEGTHQRYLSLADELEKQSMEVQSSG